jgi:hypothetical protein
MKVSGPNFNKLLQWYYHAIDATVTVAGSVSELYIEPIMRCIRDVDVMMTAPSCLAVTSRYQVPRSLPPVFDDNVIVYEIVDAEFPGYVHLLFVGRLSKRLNANTYEFTMSTDTISYFEHVHSRHDVFMITKMQMKIFGMDTQLHGPAITQKFCNGMYVVDLVISIRCLAWPTQAADWSKRHRNYNCPDASTIDYVVNNGCDVVEVAHHQCRRDEWMSTRQCRLSFSRAETVLLNSWAPIQQIVYHILRFIPSESGLTEVRDNTGEKMLSRYHLKTLMLWTCESKQSNWWQRSNVVQLVRHIKQLLLYSCESSHWRGYFIDTSNILKCYKFISRTIINQLKRFTDLTCLTDWLTENYVFRHSDLYLTTEHLQVGEISRDMKLKLIVESFVERPHIFSLAMTLRNTRVAFSSICNLFSEYQSVFLNVPTVKKWYEEVGHIDRRLQYVFIAMLCLRQIATNDVVSERSIDLMSAFLTKFDNMLITAEAETAARCLLIKAARLTQLSVTSDDHTTKSILLILSYVNLRRITHVADCDNGVTHRLVNIHFAILYHITGHYHSAVCLCKRTTHNSAQVTESFRSPNINVDIDTVQGLITLYQYLRQPSVPSNNILLTFQLFAHYLMIVSYGFSVRSKNTLFNVLVEQCRLCLLNTPKTCSTDFLVFYVLVKMRPVIDANETTARSSKFTVTELRRLLLLMSVEQLTKFQQVVFRDYQSMCRIATNDIEAMYAYQCGQYEQCLQISQQIVGSLWHQIFHLEVPIFGCMTPLMNDGMVSLCALVLLLTTASMYRWRLDS